MLCKKLLPIAAIPVLLAGCVTRSYTPPANSAWKSVEAMGDVHFAARQGYTDGAELEIEREFAPGMRHVFKSDASVPLTHNILFIDTSRPDILLEVEKGLDELKGQERVPDMMRRMHSEAVRPLAAINADFWRSGPLPVGLFIDEGTIWKGADGRRSVYAFDDQGNHFIGVPKLRMVITDGTNEIEFTDVNVGEGNDKTIVYTWPHGDAAPAPPEGMTQYVLHTAGAEWLPNEELSATVTASGRGASALNKTTIVVHTPSAAEWMKEGSEVRIVATFEGLKGKVLGAVGGGPRLVVDGLADPKKYGEEEGVGAAFVTDKHPRTAIGIMKDGKTLICLLTDGRQPRKSMGTDLIDMAAHMKELGAVQAMNLDGGGSSTMYAAGDVVNFPSDSGGPRAVSNAIVFSRTARLGPPAEIKIVPSDVLVPEGGIVDLYIQAHDRDGETVSLKDWQTRFFARDESAVSIDAQGRAHFVQTGTHDIVATATRSNDVVMSVPTPFRVEKPATFAFAPKALLLSTGEESEVTTEAATADGTAFFRNTLLQDLEVPDFLSYDQRTHRIKALKKGNGVLRAKLGGIEATLPIAVDQHQEVAMNDMDAAPAEDTAAWLDLLNGTGTLSVDKEKKTEGEASWKLEYGMTGGGASRIALPMNEEIPGEPPAVGVWIYGDGNGHWLRGELEDADGGVYYLDFTTRQSGIDWKDKWQFVRASLINPTLLRGPNATPRAPMKLRTIYLVQPQEAAKKPGTLWLDGLVALDLPPLQ